MKILAITQNPPAPGSRADRRLRRLFGDDLCDRMTWANTAPEVHGHTPPWFPADARYMLATIRRARPDIVLVFGPKAECGLFAVMQAIARSGEPLRFHFIGGPHPESPRPLTAHHLRDMARRLAALLAGEPAEGPTGRGEWIAAEVGA
ncbi:MAG: hypothetical protein GX591_12015 [Planctomycetes bacterium]|nr:hypothetical protein [Planctomycetota bacterium]